MKFLYQLFLVSILFVTAGCSVSQNTSTVDSSGPLVKTNFDAVKVGNQILTGKGGIIWKEAPKVVMVQEMSYEEANGWIGLGFAEYDRWPAETRVWLVVFNGRWQLLSMGSPQNPPQLFSYEGCIFSLFTANDGEIMQIGDAVCPTY
ncbi:MAG: hypothetical protein U0Z26_04965 [Anaerolineales bacterium]